MTVSLFNRLFNLRLLDAWQVPITETQLTQIRCCTSQMCDFNAVVFQCRQGYYPTVSISTDLRTAAKFRLGVLQFEACDYERKTFFLFFLPVNSS